MKGMQPSSRIFCTTTVGDGRRGWTRCLRAAAGAWAGAPVSRFCSGPASGCTGLQPMALHVPEASVREAEPCCSVHAVCGLQVRGHGIWAARIGVRVVEEDGRRDGDQDGPILVLETTVRTLAASAAARTASFCDWSRSCGMTCLCCCGTNLSRLSYLRAFEARKQPPWSGAPPFQSLPSVR